MSPARHRKESSEHGLRPGSSPNAEPEKCPMCQRLRSSDGSGEPNLYTIDKVLAAWGVLYRQEPQAVSLRAGIETGPSASRIVRKESAARATRSLLQRSPSRFPPCLAQPIPLLSYSGKRLLRDPRFRSAEWPAGMT